MKCKLCNNSGYVRENSVVVECSCRKKQQFREFLVSRGFKLEHVKPDFSRVRKESQISDDKFPFCKNNLSILFMGSASMDLFYSSMFACLAQDRQTRIVDSNRITGDMLEGTAMPYANIPFLGVVLGFDLTNTVQEKAMASFVFNRSAYTQTLYYFPNNLRKLETVYGDIFKEMEKEGKLMKVVKRGL